MGGAGLTGSGLFVGDCEGGACDVRVVGAVHSPFFIEVAGAGDRQDWQVGTLFFISWTLAC